VKRHIQLLAPLAFLSPPIIAAIVDGSAAAALTVTGMAQSLPHSWSNRARYWHHVGLRVGAAEKRGPACAQQYESE
jgi:hypothetical protein